MAFMLGVGRRFHLGYIRHSLEEGETVAFRARLHWLVPLLPLPLWGAVAVLWALRGVLGDPFSAVAVAFLAVVATAYQLLDWGTSEVGVTDRRLLAQVHARRFAVTYRYGGLGEVTVRQDRLGRKLGYGTVVIQADSWPFGDIILRWVEDPYALRRTLLRQLAAYEAPVPALRKGRKRRKW